MHAGSGGRYEVLEGVVEVESLVAQCVLQHLESEGRGAAG